MSRVLSMQQRHALLRLRGVGLPNFVERYGGFPDGGLQQWCHDTRVACEMTLKANHHDDNEVVDAEWLESVGFNNAVDDVDDWCILGDDERQVVTVQLFNGVASVVVCDVPWPFDIHARGQLRGLCYQAGIVLSVD